MSDDLKSDYHLDVTLDSESPYIAIPLFKVTFRFYDRNQESIESQSRSFHLFASSIVEAASLAHNLAVDEAVAYTACAKPAAGVRVEGIVRVDDSVLISPYALDAFREGLP